MGDCNFQFESVCNLVENLNMEKGMEKEKEYTYTQVMELIRCGDIDPLDSVQLTSDGCLVEPDGICPHGFKSPLLIVRMI